MTEVLVEAKEICRRFGEGEAAFVALHPATFAIAEGDQIALLGPSGSGKSTLLNIVAGLDEPTTGRINWPDIGARETLRPLAVGMIHQFSSLVPTLSVAENVALPLRLAHLTDGASRIAGAIEAVGLTGFGDRMPGELSGGQTQRAAIARTLAHQPKLLIADEPTGQLDRETGRAVLDVILAQAAASGAAVLIATHDEGVAIRMNRQWRLDHGHIVIDARQAAA